MWPNFKITQRHVARFYIFLVLMSDLKKVTIVNFGVSIQIKQKNQVLKEVFTILLDVKGN